MASAMKKVEKIRQIVHLKQVMKRWKSISLGRRRPAFSDSDSASDSDSLPTRPRRIPSGYLAVYVGAERRRFVIPTRFLNLPIFVSLLKKAEEEFGFQTCGGLVFPCEVGFFKGVLKILEKDEQRFRGVELEEVFKTSSEVSFDPCKETMGSCHGFTPLLQKTRV
ncbi:protein SMALL AUXIN UP-REGULATED RNA 12-like [Magnolia sinica]|uniref:protein SMALL AUXIN UP-REGULATED RNA 12-like n=1 Tax=Magnolia sinica TaxID=86752 RepID=UPI002658CEB4|nr:protein SMALL AUXIN UP-REGULATED RNA 12-like [Magnolia sinica]